MKEPQRTGEVVLITAVVVLSVYVAAMALGYRYCKLLTLYSTLKLIIVTFAVNRCTIHTGSNHPQYR